MISKKLKKILTWVLLLLASFIYFSQRANSRAEYKSLEKALESKQDSIRVLLNKNGDLQYQKSTIEVTAKQLKDNAASLGVDKKRLENEVGNLKNLVSNLRVQASSSGKVSTTIRDTTIYLKDTVFIDGKAKQVNDIEVKARTFNWDNDFLRVYNSVLYNDSIKFNYSYDPSFTTNTYYSKPTSGLFVRKRLTTSIIFDDPNVQVTSLNSVRIVQPPQPIYKNKLVWAAGGVILGILLSK